MEKEKISIEALIEIVANGGCVKTGIDVYNRHDVLMLGKDVTVNNVNILIDLKKRGIYEFPIKQDEDGGVWDRFGKKIVLLSPEKEKAKEEKEEVKGETISDLEAKVRQISEEKKEASQHYRKAQTAIRKIFSDKGY